MRKLITILISIATFLLLTATTYYVAPTGSDNNAGTFASPFATWNKAFDVVVPGDSVVIRGGTYTSFAVQVISTSGITVIGYPSDVASNNWPVLDCYYHCDTIVNIYGDVYNVGLYLNEVQNVYLKNLEIKNVYQCDSVLSGAITGYLTSNITYDQIRVHDVGARGYWHQTGAWNSIDSSYAVDTLLISPTEATPSWPQPDTTRWINCDTWNVCDTFSTNPGNGGDCWKVVSSMGNYYEFNGCRAWNYSDDGFDPNKGERVFINCWAMSSDKYDVFNIEGNGFKTSNWRKWADEYYYQLPDKNSKRLVKTMNCLALFCSGHGFYHGVESDSTDDAIWYNNTAYKCYSGFNSRDLDLDSIGDVFRNNLVYGSRAISAIEEPYEVIIPAKYAISNNTWVRQAGYPYFTNRNIVSLADFVETDSATLVSQFTAARQVDGSLPSNKPLQLASTSDLIDYGGIIPESDSTSFYPVSYLGAAPDIGYAEYGAADSTETNILTFVLSAQTGNATIDTTNHTVSIEVAFGTTVTALTPTISLSTGATISPTSGTARNFTSAVTYTVTAADGTTTQVWTVTVTIASGSIATDILTFAISGQTGSTTINTVNHTVSLTVPYGTTVTSLSPAITLSTGATINPTSGTARNFTTPVSYTVTAQDGTTTQAWTVTVTIGSAPPEEPPVTPTGTKRVRIRCGSTVVRQGTQTRVKI